MNLFHTIAVAAAKVLIVPVIFLAGVAGYHIQSNADYQESQQNFGAAVPVVTDFYADSLQSGVTPTATSFTLVSGKDKQGVSLNGSYGFTIDQGSPSQENVFCTTVSGTAVSGCVRGLDLTTGTTSVTALEQTHNRGASVQITTAPVVNIVSNILRGVEAINQPIFYYSHPCSVSSSSTTICDKNYIDNQVTAGASPGSPTVAGIYLEANGSQASLSTPTGVYNAVTYDLVLPAKIATSSPYNIGANTIPVTNSNGVINVRSIPTSTADVGAGGYQFTASSSWSGQITGSATSTFACSSLTAKPLILNGVVYKCPSSQGSASTFLQNDGTGQLSWSNPSNRYTLSTTTDINVVNGYATSTLITIPAGFITGSSTIQAFGNVLCIEASGAVTGGNCGIEITDGNGVILAGANNNISVNDSVIGNALGSWIANVYNQSAVNSQKGTDQCAIFEKTSVTGGDGGDFQQCVDETTSAVNMTSSFQVGIVVHSNNNNITMRLQNANIIVTQ